MVPQILLNLHSSEHLRSAGYLAETVRAMPHGNDQQPAQHASTAHLDKRAQCSNDDSQSENDDTCCKRRRVPAAV